jgi:hypothetical protein
LALAALTQEVKQLTSKLGLTSELAMIDHAWALEMGRLKDLISIVAIDKGTLVLEARSHAAMQEILLRRKELIRKMNQHFASPLFQNLTVRLA